MAENYSQKYNICETYAGICDGDDVIIKKYLLPREEKNCVDKQVKTLESSNNRYLVRYKCHNCYSGVLYIVFEDYKGRNLRDYINSCKESGRLFDESTVKKCLICLLTGLKNLNSEKIDGITMSHFNLTPDSTIVTIGGEYILGEVNLYRSFDNPTNKLQRMVDLYTSPVLLNNMRDDKADIWSLGCVMYEMCTLSTPFTIEQINFYRGNNTAKMNLNNIPDCFSKELNDIIMKMLVLDPAQRISFSDLMECAYVKEEMERDYEVNDLLKDFLIENQINELNKINPLQLVEETIVVKKGKEFSVENFFKGFITTTKDNVSIYDVLCNINYYQWLLDVKIKRWFAPIDKSEGDEPYFHSNSEVLAFRFDKTCMERYFRILDLLLHFYGYVSVVDEKGLEIQSFMSDYEKRFRKWLGNVAEIQFFNRLLKSLKIVRPDIAESVKNRISIEAKQFAKDPNTVNVLLKDV